MGCITGGSVLLFPAILHMRLKGNGLSHIEVLLKVVSRVPKQQGVRVCSIIRHHAIKLDYVGCVYICIHILIFGEGYGT